MKRLVLGVPLLLSQAATVWGAPAPDLVGMSELQASQIAGQTRWVVAATLVDSVERRGTIVAQEPSPGETADDGATLNIYISDGVQVPDVTGLTEGEAEARLEEAGIGMISSQRKHVGVSPGRVGNQIPKAGRRIDVTQQIVFLSISNEMGVMIPDVVNSRLNEAIRELELLGLIPVGDGASLAGPSDYCANYSYYGVVKSTVPPAGVFVDAGGSVRVTYERFRTDGEGILCTEDGIPY